MAFLTFEDLAPFTSAPADRLDVMIRDVEALAVRAAPCLGDPAGLSEQDRAAVVAVLRGAVLRWVDYVARDDRQMTSGPFTIGQATGSAGERKPLLWPTELTQLQAICAGVSSGRGRAFLGWLA